MLTEAFLVQYYTRRNRFRQASTSFITSGYGDTFILAVQNHFHHRRHRLFNDKPCVVIEYAMDEK